MVRLRAPDPEDLIRLAGLHAASFDSPWSADEISHLLLQAGVFCLMADEGFILMRVAADEVEVLTLAVAPPSRRAGLGAALVEAACAKGADEGASNAFLEVAVDNAPALALYARTGFAEAGRRPRYYPRPAGAVDALILRRTLNTPPA